MDPGTIINVVTLVVSLLDLIRETCKNRGWARRSKRRQDELQLFRRELEKNLQCVKCIKAQADAVGAKPKSLEVLQRELQEFVFSAEDLLNRKGGCKKEDIRYLRELVMGMLQDQMALTLIEMDIKSYEIQSNAYEELKAIKEMMAKKQDRKEMMSKKHGVHINNIFQEQARGNRMLTGPLSSLHTMPSPTETLWDRFGRVHADEHLNLIVPTEASKDKAVTYVHLVGVAGSGMVKGVDEAGRLIKKAAMPEEEEELEKENKKEKKVFWTKQGAGKDVPENEEKNKLGRKNTKLKDYEELQGAGKDGLEEEEKKSWMTLVMGRKNTKVKDSEELEGAGKEVLENEEEKKKNNEARPVTHSLGIEKDCPWLGNMWEEDKEKQDQRTEELKDDEEQDNPNCNMELTEEEGKGELSVSKHMGSQFKMTYKWCGESMGMVIGKKPMEVSAKLGYFYFEVKLVKMAELLTWKETRLAGVGVGLTRLDKFRPGKMAGKYSKSCGYDGRVGEVYYENRVQGTSKIGHLAEGDTLGIGLLQHRGRHPIFFTKNGVLRVCIRDHSLGTNSCLYPVISLASAHVELNVNFHCAHQLSELLAQVKATLPHE